MVSKFQCLIPENTQSRGSFIADLSPREKQLFTFNSNGKDSMQQFLACIFHTTVLQMQTWSHTPWKPFIAHVAVPGRNQTLFCCIFYHITVFEVLYRRTTIRDEAHTCMCCVNMFMSLHRTYEPSLVPRPHLRERVWWHWLIPRASLMLITFWREISLRQSHCRNTICSATPEILGCFSAMTQHFFWHVN